MKLPKAKPQIRETTVLFKKVINKKTKYYQLVDIHKYVSNDVTLTICFNPLNLDFLICRKRDVYNFVGVQWWLESVHINFLLYKFSNPANNPPLFPVTWVTLTKWGCVPLFYKCTSESHRIVSWAFYYIVSLAWIFGKDRDRYGKRQKQIWEETEMEETMIESSAFYFVP